jgi:hypothetical protein
MDRRDQFRARIAVEELDHAHTPCGLGDLVAARAEWHQKADAERT